MEMNFDELLGKVTDFIKSEAKTETIIGESFKLGEFTCVPVMKVGVGFGSMGGEGTAPKQGKGEGGGAAGGIGLVPMGFLVSKGQEVTFVSTENNMGLSRVFERVPDLIEKFMHMKAKERMPV